jgi:hypothetical protein
MRHVLEKDEYLIIREMQVKNFNEMKQLFPSCELKKHNIKTQTFNNLKKKEFFFFFSIDWDDSIIGSLCKKLEEYVNVFFVLPDNNKKYPNNKLKKIKIHTQEHRYGRLRNIDII